MDYNMDKNQINLNSFYYDMAAAGFKRLGDPKRYPWADFPWNADEKNRFLHWNYSRIWCVTKGSGHVETTQGSFQLQEGYAYFIPQNTLVSAGCDDYMEQYFIDFLILSDFIPMENLFSFKMVSNNISYVLELLKSIIKDKHDKSSLARFRTMNALNAIIAHFVSDYKLSLEKFKPFLQVIKTINEQYKEQISVASLAKSIGYNSEYFSRTFKLSFGITPQAYLINKRLSIAKHLLMTTNLSINTVASESGYLDPLYFTKSFTKTVGVSPSTFRSLSSTESSSQQK